MFVCVLMRNTIVLAPFCSPCKLLLSFPNACHRNGRRHKVLIVYIKLIIVMLLHCLFLSVLVVIVFLVFVGFRVGNFAVSDGLGWVSNGNERMKQCWVLTFIQIPDDIVVHYIPPWWRTVILNVYYELLFSNLKRGFRNFKRNVIVSHSSSEMSFPFHFKY